jgi:hypothetical protein
MMMGWAIMDSKTGCSETGMSIVNKINECFQNESAI